jgi:hypothetical protein
MARKKPVQSEGVTRFVKREFFGPRGHAPLTQESWTKNARGEIVKYALAYIDFNLCRQDNGRALGYDNAHAIHERHFMGTTDTVPYRSYEATLRQFYAEVRRLREVYDE